MFLKTRLEGDSSKYQQVKTNIKRWILSGEVDAEGKIPSENELSELFGVSRHTIRQAIGELVNEGWLYREHGRGTFVRMANGQSRNLNTQLRVAVITTYLVDYIFPHIIQGIETELVAQGHSLSLYSTGNDQATERRALEMALQQGVDGLIVEPTKSTHPNPNIDLYLLMQQRNIPFVMLHSSYIELNASVVQLDDTRGSLFATQHLFDLGHRTIGGIFKSDDVQGRARFRGFVKAHQDNHAPVNGELIRTYTTEDKERVVERYVNDFVNSMSLPPTAVVCYNDEIAVQLMGQFRTLGIHVPSQVSVTGFDDSALASNELVQLTTVRHPKHEMGEVAAKMLLDILGNKESMWVPREQVFEPQLVVRSSTGRRI